MSHVATIELELKDLDAIEKAADALGMRLVRNAGTFNYYGGAKDPCVHKLVLKDAAAGAYEVGLRYADNTQTTFNLATDFYGQHGANLKRAIGSGGVELKKMYTAQISAAQLRKQGYRVTIKADAGQYRIRGLK